MVKLPGEVWYSKREISIQMARLRFAKISRQVPKRSFFNLKKSERLRTKKYIYIYRYYCITKFIVSRSSISLYTNKKEIVLFRSSRVQNSTCKTVSRNLINEFPLRFCKPVRTLWTKEMKKKQLALGKKINIR